MCRAIQQKQARSTSQSSSSVLNGVRDTLGVGATIQVPVRNYNNFNEQSVTLAQDPKSDGMALVDAAIKQLNLKTLGPQPDTFIACVPADYKGLTKAAGIADIRGGAGQTGLRAWVKSCDNVSVVSHKFLHTIGLTHPNNNKNKNSLMYPIVPNDKKQACPLAGEGGWPTGTPSDLSSSSPFGGFVELPTMTWSYDGAVSNQYCSSWNESADPYTWENNHLCSSVDIGLQFSQAQPIPGMSCMSVDEPGDPDAWADNYVCIPADQPYQSEWSYNGNPSPGSTECVLVNEPADPHYWGDNYLCLFATSCAAAP